MQRIEVTSDGVTLTSVTEPLVSVFGKEMRPGTTSVFTLPWDEIADVSLAATELPPDGERRVELTVDVTWGEYFEVHGDAQGFMDAVREFCLLSGLPVPDMATVTAAGLAVWPADASRSSH